MTRMVAGAPLPAKIAGGGLLAACLIAGTALPARAQSAEERQLRLRQLEAFEGLLTETVQSYVARQLDAGIQEEQVQVDADGDGVVDSTVDPVVVRVGAALPAHGMFIEGYGVIFSIQRPQVSVLPRAFATYFEQPMALMRPREEPGGPAQRVSAGVIRFRTAMIRRQLEELEALLAREMAENATPASIEQTTRQIEDLQRQLAEMESRFTPIGERPVADGAAAQPPPEPPAGGDEDRAGVWAPLGSFQEMMQQQRSMAQVLERNHVRIREAVNEAAVDTLASYGAVIKGLRNEDRLSVLVMPPTPWGLAQRHGVGVATEEYVISVRYGDIREYDNQKIDLAEFRRRVQLHNRLGLAVGSESPEH